MTPPDNSADRPRANPPHCFPDGLEFLAAFRKLEQTGDREMKHSLAWTLLENLRNSTELLRAHGFDPDKLIGPLEKALNAAARTTKDCEEANEQLLQATANKADATRAFVDAFENFVKAASEERPFDPHVEDATDSLEELRRIYPKID